MLQDYRQSSVQLRPSTKLGPKYFGPFQILCTVGPVAYKFDVPASTEIHLIVHVSRLKAFVGILKL